MGRSRFHCEAFGTPKPGKIRALDVLGVEARTLPRVWHLPLYLSLFLGVTQVALGLFATAATINGWGTHLDVHTIDFIAVGRQPLEFAPGSAKQCWWLIGVPYLVVFPAIYMMSLGGIAFGVMMASKQRQVDRQAAATVGGE